MAMRKPRRNLKAGGGKPPVAKPPAKFKPIRAGKGRGMVAAKVTGKGKRGVGLGLKGKGRSITKKGYTGKGAYGYGQGRHGVVGKSPTGAGQVKKVGRPSTHKAGTRRAPGHNAGPPK